MDLTPYVSSLRHELAIAADAGGDDARALAERLTAPLESAVRLVLLDALSAAAAEITRDLGRRRRQRVQQDEPYGRLQRCGEPLGQRAGVVTARIGGYRELMTEAADVRREVHDVSMTS